MADLELLVHGRPAPAPRPEEARHRVPARNVALYLGVSLRTLDRWLADPEMRFPRPAAVERGRRYWRIVDVTKWEESRATEAA